MTSHQTPTFMDHHYLNFWLWACLHDGEAYLAASGASRSSHRDLGSGGRTFDVRAFHEKRLAAQREMELAKYHFVASLGSLLHNLKRSQSLFPSIKTACEQAQHLLAE